MTAVAPLSRPFRILSLSGGGVRGIFQAHFLDKLSRELGGDVLGQVDLLAATSTGSITAGALAAGLQPRLVVQLFEEVAPDLFRGSALRGLLSGPRYDPSRLEAALRKQLGTTRLGDLPVPLLLTASVVDDHRTKVFSTRNNPRTNLVDAIMASCAAPTYFPPRRIQEDARAFYDGGLWANDPSAMAVQHARDDLGHAVPEVRLLSLGTGRVQTGSSALKLDRLRAFSLETIRTLLEMSGSLQADAAVRSVDLAIQPQNRLYVNPVLAKWIPLDDATGALESLPGVAASAFDELGGRALELLTSAYQPPIPGPGAGANPIAAEGIAIANLTRFTPSRKFYGVFREGRESITGYASSARHELILVGVNFMTGDTIEHMTDTFRAMLSRQEGSPNVSVSLLNPSRAGLMEALSGNMQISPEELRLSISNVLARLKTFRASLVTEQADCFKIFVHNTLPSASAIMIDAGRPEGVIQLETNVYRAPGIESYGFEIGSGSEFYDKVNRAYRLLIHDGERIE